MRVTFAYAVVAAIFFASFCGEANESPPFTVQDGILLRDGEPYQAVGMNYFNVFYRRIQDPEDTTYRDGLETLAEHEIPFIRFMATGFWPVYLQMYVDDPDQFFELRDGVVEAAEELGIGLIPSLFWYNACVPDLVGEPRSAWGDLESETIAFMRQYTQDIVTRYLDSPAIWVWEFGNEYDLSIDLPNAEDHRPPIWPSLGTPDERSEADDLTREMVITAFAEFADTVRAIDPYRPITSGNSIPRPGLYHMTNEGTWTKDTPEQFKINLDELHPNPMDMLSIHVYPQVKGNYFNDPDVSYQDLFEISLEASEELGKPLFIGEFGASSNVDGGIEAAREEVFQVFDALMATDFSLAAYWVFDLPQQTEDHSVTADNERAYVLELIRDTNRHLWAEPDESYSDDGWTYQEKMDWGLDPFSADTSGDGIPDRWIYEHFADQDWVAMARNPAFGETMLDTETEFTMHMAFETGSDPNDPGTWPTHLSVLSMNGIMLGIPFCLLLALAARQIFRRQNIQVVP